MYKRRTQGAKRDPVKQWALPDRAFFAAGACHMLAYAFLDLYPDSGFESTWIRPYSGHTGTHIVLLRNEVVEAGADDYVTKPFGIRELRARVAALLRRSQPDAGPE